MAPPTRLLLLLPIGRTQIVVRDPTSPGTGPSRQLPWAQNGVSEAESRPGWGSGEDPAQVLFPQNIIHIASASDDFRSLFQKQVPRPLMMRFPGSSEGKEFTCNAGDLGLIPGSGKSPGGGHGNPL